MKHMVVFVVFFSYYDELCKLQRCLPESITNVCLHVL